MEEPLRQRYSRGAMPKADTGSDFTIHSRETLRVKESRSCCWWSLAASAYVLLWVVALGVCVLVYAAYGTSSTAVEGMKMIMHTYKKANVEDTMWQATNMTRATLTQLQEGNFTLSVGELAHILKRVTEWLEKAST